MSLQGFYTNKGSTLAAKIAAGTTALTVTRVVAGSGHTADIPSATALPDIEQTLTVGTAVVEGVTATLPVTLAEAQAASSYSLTELGVYATDPTEGEILMQVYQLDAAMDITAHGESVLRFFLRQSIGTRGVTVSCSPVGIVLDGDLDPLRGKVMAVSVPEKSETLAADDLQDYLDALPRLLAANYVITVSGTCTEEICISGFYGGSIKICAGTLGDAVFTKTVTVENCSAPISFEKIKWQLDAAATNNTWSMISRCSTVYAYGCSFNGYGGGQGCGIRVERDSHIRAMNCEFCNLGIAADTFLGGCIEVYGDAGSYSNNNIGIYQYYGGLVLLGNDVPLNLGAYRNEYNGMAAVIQSNKFV